MDSRTAFVLLSVALLPSQPSCTTFEIAGDVMDLPPGAEQGFETVHGSIYGFKWSDYSAQKCDDGPLARVEFHYNGLHYLASILTLGLYVPQTVEWWCGVHEAPPDEGEPGLDPNGEFGAYSYERERTS